MATNSKIEWTDHTFNPWMGCTKVSDGCKFCYAETLMDTRWGKVEWGPQGERKRTSEANWRKPLAWNGDDWFVCAKCGHRASHRYFDRQGVPRYVCPECGEFDVHITRQRVFCASLADVFEDRDELRPWRRDLFEMIAQTPNLDWLILTKRPENVMAMIAADASEWSEQLPDHVWIGTSVEDQESADKRIPELLRIPAAVRFLSCEPLLGPMDLWQPARRQPRTVHAGHDSSHDGIHWVICGGESGPNARPMHPDWARSIRDQCQAASVSFLFKQWGAWYPDPKGIYEGKPSMIFGDTVVHRLGKKEAGRELDGREWNQFPESAAVAA